MISTINKTKWGNCSICENENTEVVKVGKELFCLNCNKTKKIKVQIGKANERNKVRRLNVYQKENGFIDNQQELILDLDRVVSRYVRISAAEKDLKITCFTCDKRIKWEKSHCSHFINRSHLATRFLLKNLKCCCPTCNVTLSGNLKEYAKRLEKEQGGLVEWLTEQGHTVEKPSLNELKELLFDFQQKLRSVEVKIKMPLNSQGLESKSHS